jgi:hypothetical protein
MRALSASVESSAASSGRPFALPDADLVSTAWTDYPGAAGFPTRPDMAKSVSGAMLAIGVALLLFAPIGAVFLLLAGVVGLTIGSERSTPAATAAIEPRTAACSNDE